MAADRERRVDDVVGAGAPARGRRTHRVQGHGRLGRRETGLDQIDAYQFVSQNAVAPVVEMVDPVYTVLVKIPKARLPK